MINTEKVTGFYTDVFGNEIDEYEQIERYTVMYNGSLFEGDSEGFNSFGVDNWNEAKAIYDMYPDQVRIQDNEYDVVFSKGEWY